MFSAEALQPMPFWLLLWWSGNSLMTRRRLTCGGLDAATGAKGSATRLFVAEHDVKLRLYFFAAITRESTVSQHLQHACQQRVAAFTAAAATSRADPLQTHTQPAPWQVHPLERALLASSFRTLLLDSSFPRRAPRLTQTQT